MIRPDRSEYRRARWRIAAVLALLLATPLATAQTRAEPALPDWEQLSPAQREQLTAPLRQRWNSQPMQRQRMLERARRWQALTPDQRQRAQRGLERWRKMSPQQRERAKAVFQKMREMSPEQRRALRERWQRMSPQQRREWLQQGVQPGE